MSLAGLNGVRLSLHMDQSRASLAGGNSSISVTNVQTIGSSSTMATTVNFITVMVGAGVLGFPKLFSKMGIPLGLILLVICCAISVYLCTSLGTAIGGAQRRTGRRILKLDDMGEACFGAAGAMVARICVNGMFLAKIAIYMVLVGQNLNYVGGFLPYRAWVLATAAALYPVAFLKDVSVIERMAIIGVLASGVYFVTIVAGGFKNANDREGDLDWAPKSAATAFSVLTVMMFGFGPCDVIATARREMATPEELPTALLRSHIVVCSIYISAGIIGYWGFGPLAEGNISMSMCDAPGCPGVMHENSVLHKDHAGSKWIWGFALAAAVVANLAVTIPILLYCLFSGIEACYTEDRPMPSNLNNAMRVGTVTICTVVGLFMPFFLEVVSVVSAALVVPICFYLPLSFSWKAAKDSGDPHPPWRLYLDAGLLVLGIACMIIGLVDALSELSTAMTNDPEAANPFNNFFA